MYFLFLILAFPIIYRILKIYVTKNKVKEPSVENFEIAITRTAFYTGWIFAILCPFIISFIFNLCNDLACDFPVFLFYIISGLFFTGGILLMIGSFKKAIIEGNTLTIIPLLRKKRVLKFDEITKVKKVRNKDESTSIKIYKNNKKVSVIDSFTNTGYHLFEERLVKEGLLSEEQTVKNNIL